jgi:hypothetical protein
MSISFGAFEANFCTTGRGDEPNVPVATACQFTQFLHVRVDGRSSAAGTRQGRGA